MVSLNLLLADWSNTFEVLGRFFYMAVVFVVILVLAYYSTKLVAAAKFSKRGSHNVQIVESVHVGFQSSIQLVKAGSKYFLIGVSKERVTFLTQVDEDGLSFDDAADIKNNIPFEKYLNKLLPGKKDE